MKRGEKQRGWDIDLPIGEYGENKLVNILQGGKIECKFDIMALETGNLFVEYESWGKPSGIVTTEASHWAFILDNIETIIIIEIKRLKEIARRHWDNKVSGGDEGKSKGVLVPLQEVFDN